jgi:hypothetical protein
MESPFDISKENLSLYISSINAVAVYCNCSEKTVRRALKSKGIIKGQLIVTKIDTIQ